MVRAIMSATSSRLAPSNAAAGTRNRWRGTHDKTQEMGHDEADEADCPTHRNGSTGQQGRCHNGGAFQHLNIHPHVSRFRFTKRQPVEAPRQQRPQAQSHDNKQGNTCRLFPGGTSQDFQDSRT